VAAASTWRVLYGLLPRGVERKDGSWRLGGSMTHVGSGLPSAAGARVGPPLVWPGAGAAKPVASSFTCER